MSTQNSPTATGRVSEWPEATGDLCLLGECECVSGGAGAGEEVEVEEEVEKVGGVYCDGCGEGEGEREMGNVNLEEN